MFMKLVMVSVVIVVAVVVVCKRLAKKKKQEAKLRAVVFAGMAAIALIWWGFYWSNPERDSGSIVLNESALSHYSIDQYPRFYEKWGEEGIKRIEDRERVALEKISSQKLCDSVYVVGLAENQSTPPDNIVIFGNCENNYQFYVGPDGNILSYRKTH
ncbi:hypothetical protein [Pseudomonas lundensis]|uniref:hypothetical protein n=1 Tax=Pseudomonas lundensis TaxID=86185 RepID=UPI001474F841|nr:hypothetical protein [Pseudomonas lundensis]NNA29901.1 hypothetical protein [Pseudomonas lundensis]